MNFKKLAIATAVSLVSFNAAATDWANTDFDSAQDIADNLEAVYSVLGGDIADFMGAGEGGNEMATLLLELSDFTAGVAPVVEVDDENNEIVITEGVAAVGSIASINTQVQTTMNAVEGDLLGDGTWEFDDDAETDDSVATDANAGLAKTVVNTINNELVDIVALSDNANTDADGVKAFNDELDSYFNKEGAGGFQADADKYNEVLDGVSSLAGGLGAAAADYSGGFTDHASFSAFDVATEASSITADVEIVTIANRGFSYGSYSDLVQGAAELDYQASAQALGDENVTLVEGMTAAGDDTSALFVMSNFGSTGGSLSFSIGSSVDGFQLTADLTFNGVTLAKADYDEYATMDELYQDIMEALLEADQG